jgi:hypothetical protein
MTSEAKVCFLAREECSFLLGLISNLKKIVERFTGAIPIVAEAESEGTTNLTVTDIGLVAMIYYKAFNEEYPENPDVIQQQKIDAVIDALRNAGVFTGSNPS